MEGLKAKVYFKKGLELRIPKGNKEILYFNNKKHNYTLSDIGIKSSVNLSLILKTIILQSSSVHKRGHSQHNMK